MEGKGRNGVKLNTDRQVLWLSCEACRKKEGEKIRTREKERAKLPFSDVQI
jgi:hypothetical protein